MSFFHLGCLILSKTIKSEEEAANAWLEDYKIEPVEITSHDGLVLKGKIVRLLPDTKKVVLAIGGHQTSGMKDMSRFTQMYQELGFDACIIDPRACGDSEGHYGTFGYEEQKDVLDWCKKLIEVYGETVEILLHGVSVGAATVCCMSGSEELPTQVIGGISDSAFETLMMQMRHLLNTQTQLPVEFTLMMLNMIGKQKLKFDFKQLEPVNAVKKSKIPMVFIQGEADTYVPKIMAEHLYDACASEQKKYYEVSEAKHKGCYVLHPNAYGRYIKEWLTTL